MKPWSYAVIALFLSATHNLSSAQERYAVVIGVATYNNKTLSNVKYATNDVKELGEQLSAVGYRTTVMNSFDASARLFPTTPQKIAEHIIARTQNCTKDDTLLIVLTGQSVQFADEEILATDVRETYFCSSYANLDDKSTLLKLSSVLNFMNRTKAGHKLLVVDAFQEVILTGEGRKKNADRISTGSEHENDHSFPGGTAVLFSCSNGQYSRSHNASKHSVFAYHFIEYLKGNADPAYYDSDKLQLSGLVSYVSKQTNDYVVAENLSPNGQLPVLRGNNEDWTLGEIFRPAPQEFANAIGMEFKLIPTEQFFMGDGKTVKEMQKIFPEAKQTDFDDTYAHIAVIRKPFYLAKHEVTVGQFRRFVSEQNYVTEAESNGTGGFGFDSVSETLRQDPKFNWKDNGFSQTDDHPVVNVSWNDAQRFLAWLSEQDQRTYVLPTEAQWEYACRAGQVGLDEYLVFTNGNDPEALALIGNVADSSLERHLNPDFKPYLKADDGYAFTAPVGSYPASKFGIFDMHGNAFEWCADWYAADYPGIDPGSRVRIDPSGPPDGMVRVIRGGSWGSSAIDCRSAARSACPPDLQMALLGFRVATEE